MAHSADLATLSALARTVADAVPSLSMLAHAPAGTAPTSFEPATSLALARTVAGALRIEYFTANIFYYPVHTLSVACLCVGGWVDH